MSKIIKVLFSKLFSEFKKKAPIEKEFNSSIKSTLEQIEWGHDWINTYIGFHLNRISYSLQLLKDYPKHINILEIGAMPYTMTVLLKSMGFENITTTNWDPNLDILKKNISLKTKNNNKSHEFDSWNFNVEKHIWPFDSNFFDLVVISEVMEHLMFDPMHVIAEANRVLKREGRIFISTPNSSSLHSLRLMYIGLSPSRDPYYRANPYNRHNRELTYREVREMLRQGGFHVEYLKTLNFDEVNLDNVPLALLLAVYYGAIPLKNRRDYIISIGKKTGQVKCRYPLQEKLYKNPQEYK